MSLILMKTILSLFLIMLMGFLAVRCRVLQAEQSMVLSRVMLYLVTPCMLISAFQITYSDDARDRLMLAFAGAALIHIGMLALVRLLCGVLHLDETERLTVIYSNGGNLIIPIVSALLGQDWLLYCSAYIAVQQVLMWSHGKAVLCREEGVSLKKIFANINMAAIFLGLLLFFTGVRLPEIVLTALETVGGTMGTLAMLISGMLIGGLKAGRIASYRRLWLPVCLRLVLIPLLAVLFFALSPLKGLAPDGERVLLISLLATIAPSASAITAMVQIYGGDADYASAINVVTTLLCIVTMPAMVLLYQALTGL